MVTGHAAAPVRIEVDDLGRGPSVTQALLRAADRPGLVCLLGRFADGHAVLSSHPVRTVRVLPTALPEPPDGAAPVVAGVPVLGGGWFGVLGHGADATHLAWHDHVVRRVGGRWRVESRGTPARAAALAELRAQWAELLADATDAADAPDDGFDVGAWQLPDRDGHLAAVERAIGEIRAGEVYQVNVCTRLSAPFSGSAAALFAAAAQRVSPAWGALVTTPAGAVACLSPELFWQRRDREIVSEPIKGTLPVGPGNAGRLRRSAKDVAENVMIVDLVRNDLGRVCVPGSVRPARLLAVTQRLGVLHLVSSVRGRLRDGVADPEVSAALFPPASVTGTPKLRALQVIADVESGPRGAYTGAVGVLAPGWGSEFAVAIRTLEVGGGRVGLGVGGGVTVDSVPSLEWQECRHKARPVVTALGGELPGEEEPPATVDPAAGVLETVLVLDGAAVRLADHLARLERSTRELWDRALPPDLLADVAAAAARAPAGRAALRIVVAPDGQGVVSVRALGPRPAATVAVVVARADGLWRHKWADRAWAARAEEAAGPGRVPLFVAADGAVLETSRGNVVLVASDGGLVTPPLRPDLLPGVTRRALLDHARDVGRPVRLHAFGLDELHAHAALWTSSLSGAVPITEVDGVPLPRADEEVAAVASALVGRAPVASPTARHRRATSQLG